MYRMLGRSLVLFLFLFKVVLGHYPYHNETLPPAERQLEDFAQQHPHPVGVLTSSFGAPSDIREISTTNSDFTRNSYFIDNLFHFTGERIPLRVVSPKGIGAHGYFQVTNDISKYTKADFLNGIGKKTPLFLRMATGNTNRGGADITRDVKPFAFKFYTKEGNQDLLCLSFPVYFYRDPINFPNFVHVINKNPKHNFVDWSQRWDLFTSVTESLHTVFYLLSDFGLPRSYRRLNAFPIHTFPLTNKDGEIHYVRFSFRSELSPANFTDTQAELLNGVDQDFLLRDMYNALERKEYPSWRMEIDVLKTNDLKSLDFNPFDETRLWPKYAYKTVPVGRVTLTRNVDNWFVETEQSAFNPGTLVPGINPPVSQLFRGRNMAYPDTQRHRLGRNKDNIEINRPQYAKTYRRDGPPPARDNLNMKDAPNYYPNHFNGPAPYVDAGKMAKNIVVLDKTAYDLAHVSHFYNHILPNDASRQRLAQTISDTLAITVDKIQRQTLRFMYYVDPDLSRRILDCLKNSRTIEQRTAEIVETTDEILKHKKQLHV